MKVFNNGANVFGEVIFACENCGSTWTTTYSKLSGPIAYNRPKSAFYYLSSSRRAYMCDCPNCNNVARTPIILHEAYVKHINELNK